jgi:uncharacterized peroxidase-related enzyme
MARLKAIDPTTTTGKAKELLNGVQKTLGMTPNMMRAMANSPAVLEGYLNFGEALGKGRLGAKLREQIALTVAEINACEYCLAAHTALGKLAGLGADELSSSRHATSADPKVEAALVFARHLVVTRGEVDAAQVALVRDAGYGDGEIAEIVGNVAINIFTNYFNTFAQTEVDFPKVSAQGSPA